VPVSVLDKSGKFVADLNKQDFQVLVDGKTVEITSFDAVKENSPPAAGNSGPTLVTRTTLPPNTFRNISEFSASQSSERLSSGSRIPYPPIL